MIQGIAVTLINKIEVGEDEFNHPIYEESRVIVDNVLVAPTESTDVIDQLNLTGKKAVYTLGIPKGDNHIWEDQDVEFFGERFHVFTPQIRGIEVNVPTKWHSKVMVEKYEF